MPDDIKAEAPSGDWRYTAFEHWEYKPLLYKMELKQEWVDLADGFYQGSRVLVDGVLRGGLHEDIEGVAAIFMFRHYLELILKKIVFCGRRLTPDGELVPLGEIKEVAKEHSLSAIWKWVLADAKPKIADESWKEYDVAFVEKLIAEIDGVDPKGFTFRYPEEDGNFYRFDFAWMLKAMEHAEQVLGNMLTYLIEQYHQTLDFLADLRLEAGY